MNRESTFWPCLLKRIESRIAQTLNWNKESKLESELFKFKRCPTLLTIQNGLLMKGSTIVIPQSLREDILGKLHEGHLNTTNCRERAKQSICWPGLSSQLQKMVEKCEVCARGRVNPKETPLPTKFPDRPWSKVGIDLFQLINSTWLWWTTSHGFLREWSLHLQPQRQW